MIVVDVRMLEASGVGVYLKQLLPRVIAWRPNVRFILLGRRKELGRYDWSRAANVRLEEFSAPIYSISEQLQMPAKVTRDAALLWSPHFNIPLFVRKKLLVTVHDVFHLAMPQVAGGPHKQAYARLMFLAVARKAGAILTVSDFTRRELLRLTQARSDKIHVTLLGADPAWLAGTNPGSPPHPRPYLLYVGNVKPHKNLIALLQAFRSLRTSIPHDLVILGKREGFLTGDPKVAETAQELGDRVRFTGFLPDEQLKAYFSHASALVHPSLYEGFGLSPLEAMACGTPALVSRSASLPEVCGDAALYFDPQDPADIAKCILRLVREPDLADDLKDRGRARAGKFSWDRTAAATLVVLDRLLGGPSPAGKSRIPAGPRDSHPYK